MIKSLKSRDKQSHYTNIIYVVHWILKFFNDKGAFV